MKPLRITNRSRTRQKMLCGQIVINWRVIVHYPQDTDMQEAFAAMMRYAAPLRAGFLRDDMKFLAERCNWHENADAPWERVLICTLEIQDVEVVANMYGSAKIP